MKQPIGSKLIPTLVIGLFSGCAAASGFQLLEQSASALGTAFAGTGVLADDASTVFTNPAGMALLPQGKISFAASLSGVKPTAEFSNQGSTAALFQPLGNGTGGDAGSLAALPAAYVVMPINSQISIGVGVNAPFGLKTVYDPAWYGRFQGVKSDVKTINVNPSLSFKVNDTVSLGIGVNYQRLEGEFTSSANYAAIVFQAAGGVLGLPLSGILATAAGQGSAQINGSDSAWGYDVGALFQVTPATRLGFSYRSAIQYHVVGTASFSQSGNAQVNAILNNPASPVRGGPIYADIKLPDTATLSGLTRLNDKWDVVGDVAWTGWAKIPDLTFKYQNNSSVVSSTPENWRNTWRVALGAVHRYNDDWKIRFGIAYDQTPVGDDARRTVRLPDSNRTWLAFGGQYRLDKDSAIDFGYSHLFIKDGSMNQNDGSTNAKGLVLGSYSNSVDILGIQYSKAF